MELLQCYIREKNEARDRYSKATREIIRLELALSTTQVALSAFEGETSAPRALLADANARVAGKSLLIDNILPPIPSSS